MRTKLAYRYRSILVAALLLCAGALSAQTTEPQSNLLPQAKAVKGTPVSNVAGTGTTDMVPKWLDGAGTLGNSNLYSDPALGRIGIGTTTPTGQLHIFGTANQDVFSGMGVDLAAGPAFNFGYAGSSFGVGAGFFNVRPHASAVAPNPSLRFATANVQRMIITNTGNVGIGTTAPDATLHVAGTMHITSNAVVDGNIAAKYQDVAEWVPSGDTLSAGNVVVIDPTKANEVVLSHKSYDTSIAGVVSGQPGISLGVAGEGKYKIATLGRVRVKVDATKYPIAAGDLLVTSDVPGMAMKSVPVNIAGVSMHKPGTLLGKALEPLSSGTGEILVLLSLQ